MSLFPHPSQLNYTWDLPSPRERRENRTERSYSVHFLSLNLKRPCNFTLSFQETCHLVRTSLPNVPDVRQCRTVPAEVTPHQSVLVIPTTDHMHLSEPSQDQKNFLASFSPNCNSQNCDMNKELLSLGQQISEWFVTWQKLTDTSSAFQRQNCMNPF